MNIYAFDFSKRPNSTAVPAGTGTSITVRLKDATSKFYPTFELSGAFPGYTYIKWDNRYYFVDDILQVANGLYDMKCSIDVMGTWRADILGSSQFIHRSASSYDIWMKDNEISAQQKVVERSLNPTSIDMFDGVGCYILRVISGSSGDPSGLTTYVMTSGELLSFLNWMFSSDVWDGIWDGVIKTIFNPFQYVVSLKYTPISKTYLSNAGLLASGARYQLGWWEQSSPGTTYAHLDSGVTGGVWPTSGSAPTLTLPSLYFNDFRDYDPEFTDVKLTLPGGNTITLPSIWLSYGTIYISSVFDLITNQATLFLNSDHGILGSFNYTCCADLQIGQVSSDFNSMLGDAAGAVGSYICGNPIGLGVSAMGAISNVLQPSPSINGSQSPAQAMKTYRSLYTSITHYGAGGIPTSRYGRMYNQNATISSLSGFCKCSAASVSTNAPENLKNKIESYMNSGFYIE